MELNFTGTNWVCAYQLRNNEEIVTVVAVISNRRFTTALFDHFEVVLLMKSKE